MARVGDAAESRRERLREISLQIDLCLRIGEEMMGSGAGAADVLATIESLAWHLGLRPVDVDVTFTRLTMNYQGDEVDVPLTLQRTVKKREIDYADLTAVDHLVRELLDDRIDYLTARTRMAVLVSTGKSLPRWAVTAGWAVMCSSVAVFLGAGPLLAAVAALTATLIDRLQLLLARRRVPFFYVQVAGGGVAALLSATTAAVTGLDPSVVVSANIIMLLAGVGFMGALQDAITGFYITAGARVIEAMMATAGIIAGVSGGMSLARILGVTIGRLEPARVVGASEAGAVMVGSAVCAAAFAFASYAPRRSLAPIALVAAAGAAVYLLCSAQGFARPWASGLAALPIGLVSYAVAGRVRVPPLVIVVSAVVPLLPGLTIYRGLSLLAEGGTYTSAGLLAMVTAASVAIALAAGVLLGEYVAQPLKTEARRLEQRLAGPRLVGPLRARSRR